MAITVARACIGQHFRPVSVQVNDFALKCKDVARGAFTVFAVAAVVAPSAVVQEREQFDNIGPSPGVVGKQQPVQPNARPVRHSMNAMPVKTEILAESSEERSVDRARPAELIHSGFAFGWVRNEMERRRHTASTICRKDVLQPCPTLIR